MIINLVLDPSTAQKFPGGLESLPKAWLDPLRQAQTILERDLTDDVTVNIQIGYGEVTEQPKGLLPGKVMTVTTGGEAGPWFGLLDNYSDLITTLRAHDPANTDDIAAYKSLSATGPAGHDQIEVSRAQAKTLGLLRADDVIDGSAGFATLENLKGQQLSVGLALHELTHALGRAAFQASGFTTNGVTPAIGIEDLFRFSKEGTYEFNNIKGAYLSYDFGKTPLARFDSGPLGDHDPGDFIGITPDDPFNRDVGLSNDLSPFDITLMGVIGYTVPLALTPPPEQVTSRHVEIDITRVLQIVTGDYSLIPWNTDNTDFYGKIFINGVEHDFGVDNPTSEADFKPGWTAEQDVPGSQTLVPIRIELWDWDGSHRTRRG
jgi:hypothetical protein